MGRMRTICEVHRQLGRALKASDIPAAEALLAEAFDMGKKMDNKLKQYRHNYDEGWWQANKLAGGQLYGPPEPVPGTGKADLSEESAEEIARLDAANGIHDEEEGK